MANNNDYDKHNNRKKTDDEDYLDLLSTVGKRPEKPRNYDSRDIYSDSSRRRSTDSFRDTNDDVYIGKSKRENDNYIIDIDDIPVSSRRPSGNQRAGYSRNANTEEIPNRQPAAPERPHVKRVTDEEISDFEARHGKAPKKKKSKGGKIALAVIALILVIVIGSGAFLVSVANSVADNFTKAKDIEHISNVSSLTSESYVKNILLIGLDKEQGGSSRSDSIMIVSVNKKTGKIIMSSILRDSYVEIPGEGKHKINAAYAWGEANLLIQTIETNFGIKIDDFAVVNYSMFVKLVNGLGGINVEVTEDEADYINNRHEYKGATKPDHFESGKSVHLNGLQALWYARIRKLDSDFMRTYRQRKVMTAIINNVKSQITPTGIKGLISTAKTVAPYIETTLTKSEFYSLAFSLVSCFSKSDFKTDKLLVSQQIPFDDTWSYDSSTSDGSIVAIDIDENKKLLYNSIYVDAHENSEAETTTE